MSILLTLIIIIPHFSFGEDIIRDSEIEEVLSLISSPLARAAKLKDLKIYLINSDELNAFTTGGNKIYIYSGLINKFPDIDVVRGVIAHEIGHIVGKHIVRQSENLDNYSKIAMSSVALGLASVISGNANLASAIMVGGIHFSERSILSHSRIFESSADQMALRILEASKNSCIGMIRFFEHMEKQNHSSFVNQYDKTHPSSRERLVALRNFYNNSKFKNSNISEELQYKFVRAIAKLKAFTENPKNKNYNINNKYSAEISAYIKAISYFRIGDLNNSVLYINKLIDLKPNDPFYHELKGQILFDFGHKEAIDSYSTALRLRPNDELIKLGRAIVGITVYKDAALKMHPFYQDLKFIISKNIDNLIALYYLAVYYEHVGNIAEARLSSALIAYKIGDLTRAKILAREAIKGFVAGTPSWYRANDIIITDE